MTTEIEGRRPVTEPPVRGPQFTFPLLTSLWVGVPVLLLGTLVVTGTLSDYNIFVYNSCLLAAMGAVALNIQLGTAGQVSMGNVAFLAVGAFATAFAERSGVGWPWNVLIGGVVAGVSGLIIAIPALRLKGLYFALATVSAYFIIYYIFNRYQTRTVGESGFLFNPVFHTSSNRSLQTSWSWLLVIVLSIVCIGASLLSHGKVGRALRIIRDHEAAAAAFGVGVVRYKLVVFGLGFGVIGIQGGLMAYYSGLITIDSFTLVLTIQYLAMVIIGGLDSVPGAVIGAFLVTMLPTVCTNLMQGALGASATIKGPQVALIVYGALVIIFVTSSAGGIVGWLRSGRRVVLQKIGR